MRKEMPVIPFDRVVDPKRIIGKMEGHRGGEAQGVADPKKQNNCSRSGTLISSMAW
jgi:hypothetical protein